MLPAYALKATLHPSSWGQAVVDGLGVVRKGSWPSFHPISAFDAGKSVAVPESFHRKV